MVKKNREIKEKNINFKAIKTSGDIHQNIKLSEIGGKNLYCKEIEEKLNESASTVRVKIFRAKKMLASLLKKDAD